AGSAQGHGGHGHVQHMHEAHSHGEHRHDHIEYARGHDANGLDHIGRAHAQDTHKHDHNEHDHAHSHGGKLQTIMTHATEEFFEMGKYLIFGAMLAALVQTTMSRDWLVSVGTGEWSS